MPISSRMGTWWNMSNEDEQISITRNMDESHKHNVEWEKPETTEFMLYDPVDINFKTKQNYPVVSEKQRSAYSSGGWWLDRDMGDLRSWSCLCLDSSHCILRLCVVFLCMVYSIICWLKWKHQKPSGSGDVKITGKAQVLRKWQALGI